MSLLHQSSPLVMVERSVASMARVKSSRIDSNVVSFFKPIRDQPILRDAIKEPLAFVGGMIAGFMKLDNEDPLKEWIAKTVEASGMLDSDDDGGTGSAEGSTDGGANGAGKQIKIE